VTALRLPSDSWRDRARTGAFLAIVVAVFAITGAGVALARPRDVVYALAGVGVLALLYLAGRYFAASPAMAARVGMDRLATWCCLAAIAATTPEAVRLTSSVSIADALLVLTVAALALRYAVEASPRPMVPRAPLIAATLFILAGLVTASEAASRADVLQLGQFVLAMVGTTLIVGWAIRDTDLAARAADAWAVGAAVSSLVAIVDFALNTGIGAHVSGVSFAGREAGLSLQPNDLGVTAAIVIPWVTLRMISAHSIRATFWWSSIFVTLSAGILVSGSRSALIAVPAGEIMLLLVGRGVSRRLVPLFAGGAAVVGVVAIAVRFSGSSSFVAINRLTNTSTSVAASDNTRVERYHTAISDFLSHPIVGVGFQSIRQALDIYLQLAASGGVLALAGFGVFIVWVIRSDRVLVRAAADGPLRNLGGALAGAMVVWLVYGLFQNGIYERYLYVAAGLTVAAGYDRLRRSGPIPASGDGVQPPVLDPDPGGAR
jgi:O-Antigen ligase